MVVRRIVANIEATDVKRLQEFYRDLLGLDAIMDLGWIVTLSSHQSGVTQLSILSEGGSGAPVPDLSIEVDDVDEIYSRGKKMGCVLVYDLTDEPWGVRRFYVRDPAGKIVNILSHLR